MYVSTFHSIVSYLHVTCDTIRETEFVHSGNCFWIHQTTLVAAKHNIAMSTFLSVCLSICPPYSLPVCRTWPYACLLISLPDPLPVYLSLYLTSYLSTSLSTWTSNCLTSYLNVYLSFCLSNSLSTTLPTLPSFTTIKTYPRQCNRFLLENVTHNYSGKNLSLIPSTPWTWQ